MPIYDQHFINMIKCIKQFYEDKHQYFCDEIKQKIGYKDADHSINYKINHGYLTLFAYYEENRKKVIKNKTLAKIKNIDIKCGFFSFAEIPKP